MRTGPNLIELPSQSGNITYVVCRGSGQSVGQDHHKRREADERDQLPSPHVATLASSQIAPLPRNGTSAFRPLALESLANDARRYANVGPPRLI
jgi:hypothetical protein